jgi:serine phosphatase RsbU (regulator of sigma subunit)
MPSFPIGLLDNAQYTVSQCPVKPGTSLLMYSDGVTDIRFKDGAPFFEEQSLLDYIHTHKYADNQRMVASLLSYIKDGYDGDFQDDATIFLLKRE